MVEAAAIQCRDWRTADAREVMPLIDAEVRAWRDTLIWDVSASWSVVEPARQAGRLPGLLAHDRDGRAVGWTAFLVHERHLQVMAFVADEAAVASALLEGILASPEAATCDDTLVSVRHSAPALSGLLARRGFTVDRHHYLIRGLAGHQPGPVAASRWRDCDDAMAALCEVAYREGPGVRAFAPGGTLPEWRHYVSTLVRGNGCGWFLPELSAVVPLQPSDGPAAGLRAALMLTDLGAGVAHIAQLAVRPEDRGRGVARQLLSSVLADASRFFDRVTLLVSGENAPALRLYRAAGFETHAPFIVARRDHRAA